MEELDSIFNRIFSLSCSVSIESVSVYLVDALWFSAVTDDNIRSRDSTISEDFRYIRISKSCRVAQFIDGEPVAVCKGLDDCGWVVGVSEVEAIVQGFKFVRDLIYFFPMGEDGRL